MIMRMLHRDPPNRPTARDILHSSMFAPLCVPPPPPPPPLPPNDEYEGLTKDQLIALLQQRDVEMHRLKHAARQAC